MDAVLFDCVISEFLFLWLTLSLTVIEALKSVLFQDLWCNVLK